MTNPLTRLRNLAITTAVSIHDEEALTSLELAGRTACKVNECVNVVNEVCKYLEKNLKETLAETLLALSSEGVLTEAQIEAILENILNEEY